MHKPIPDPRYFKRHNGMKFFVEKIYLWCLNRLAWPHLRTDQHADLKTRRFKSILIIRHNMLGDAVVSSVLIQALRALHPDATISILASPYNKVAFSWIPGVHAVHVWPPGFRERRALINELKGQFDLVFQTLFDEHYNNRMLVARMIAADSVLIGRARRSPAQGLMDYPVELPVGSYASKLLALLGPLTETPLEDLVRAHPRYLLNLPERDKAAARKNLGLAGINQQPFVLLNISARENFRALGDEQATAIARGLIAGGHNVVISCAPDELERAYRIKGSVPGTLLCEHKSLGAAMAAVEMATLYVGPDTGTVHFAAAACVPCVVLFADIARPDVWSPYGSSFISLQAGLNQLVAEIPAETILRCALELLAAGPQPLQRIELGGLVNFSAPPRDSLPFGERTPAVKLIKKIAIES